MYLPNRVSKQAHGQQHQLTIEYLLMNRYANYVIQASYEVSDEKRRQVLLDQIQYTLSTNHNAGRETPLKHVLKYLQKFDIYVRGNQLQGSGCRPTGQANIYGFQSQSHPHSAEQNAPHQQRNAHQYKQQPFEAQHLPNFHTSGPGAVMESPASSHRSFASPRYVQHPQHNFMQYSGKHQSYNHSSQAHPPPHHSSMGTFYKQ